MTMEKPAAWSGASGTEYAFEVFDLAMDVPARLGIFAYAKRNDEGAWVPILFGAGDLAARCTDTSLLQCVDTKKPTHVHLRLVKREEDRADELQDLLAKYENAFAEGCQPEADRPAVARAPDSTAP